MNIGERTHETASCWVMESKAVPEHMRDGVRELLSVFTPIEDRRKGYATALLRSVCMEADEAGKVLMLTAEAMGDIPADVLTSWYARFGFQVIQSEPMTLMARRPRVEQPQADAPAVLTGAGRRSPELQRVEQRASELRKAGVPLGRAVHQAIQEAAGRERLRLSIGKALH